MHDRRQLSGVSRELIDAGISMEAIHTTLKLQGRDDLRELITSDSYLTPEGVVRNMVFSSRTLATSERTGLLLHLVAKEMYLHGIRVEVATMDDMMQRNGHVRYVDANVGFVFLPAFYVTSKATPWVYGNPREVEQIHKTLSLLHYKYNIGIGVYVDGTGVVDSLNWWSTQLVNFINKTSIEIKVTANV